MSSLRLLSSMATKAVLQELLTPGVVSGMPATEPECGGGVVIAGRVRDGDPADLVVLAQDAIDRLVGEGHVLSDSVRPLFVSEVVVAVREDGSDERDLSTVGSLLEALSDVAAIGYSTGPSGDGLLRLLEERGVRDDLESKLVQAQPGHPVARLLADGQVEIGIQQRSEFAGVAGVRVVGTLPPGAEIITTFTGAVLISSAQVEDAGTVLDLLSSHEAAAIVERHGLAPA
jgi:molybdate transport system substrate-binding protein